ncbi:hypothetical protein BV898_14003 [Hypsibius exemplaris]|uniref:Receptor ligand binding region domain-containing protein n=1 Tax=Hypsibius exemplaris TaxID=2072580 RepID=A0A1W0W8Y1_HYPEX|nr:hypothetical protein BV898_14003 [Hypsibius exemplaris]
MENATVSTIYPNATGGVLEFCIVERVPPPTIPTTSKAPATRDAHRILQIEVLTLIMAFPVRLGALTFTGPAFDQARVDISRAYPYLNITQTYVYSCDQPYVTWNDQYENAQAYQYFVERRKREQQWKPDVTVFAQTVDMGAKLATGLDDLYLSSVIMLDNLRDKQKWPTWITRPQSLTDFLRTFESMMRHFHWLNVVLFAETTLTPSRTLLHSSSAVHTQAIPTAQATLFTFNSTIQQNYGALMAPVKHLSRVIFYTGNVQDLQSLLTAAADLNMTNGDYVYFTFSALGQSTIMGVNTWTHTNKTPDDVKLTCHNSLHHHFFFHTTNLCCALHLQVL